MKEEVVQFAGAELVAIEDGDKKFVALKPISDILGLHWSRQRQSINDDPVLNSVVRELRTTGSDGKQYEMVCLPLDYLNGWLFKIDARRYKGERQALIIRYQKECYRALADHFLGGRSVSSSGTIPRPCPYSPSSTAITPSAALDAIRAAVERTAQIDAANIRFDMLCLAERYKITDPDEFLSLASAAVLPDADATSPVPVHPGTFRRAVARLMAATAAGRRR